MIHLPFQNWRHTRTSNFRERTRTSCSSDRNLWCRTSSNRRKNRKSNSLRPCVRRNFLSFLFSRVSEMFGCQSLEIFRKNWNFWTHETQKKVWILFKNVSKFWKFQKKYVKFEFLSQKNLFLGQKVRKKFRKLENRVFRMFGNCSIPKFPKIMNKWR